ncbi:MAG: hypothetical protein ABSB58_01040 [Gemmatimonadales bacterium]|jgi:hypothetical protein
MRRASTFSACILLASTAALTACGPRDGSVRYPRAAEGSIVVERSSDTRLVDVAARATYCRQDSLLVIIAVDRRWSAGLVVRGPFPPKATRTFTVRPALAGDGTAAAAFRSVDDSIQSAVMALRGTVQIDTDPRATGRFTIGAAPEPGRSAPIHLVGAFRALPTSDTTATCSSLPRIL